MSTARAVATNVRASLLMDAEYRASMLLQVWMTLLRTVIAVAMIHIVFAQAPSLNGWNQYQVGMVYGSFLMASGVLSAMVFPSLTAMTENIRKGTLDFSLTKPADAQVIEATQRFDFVQLINAGGGLAMVIVSAYLGGIGLSIGTAALMVPVGVASVLILYAFHLLVATTAFWFVKLDMLMDQLHEMFNVTRWPTSLYPDWMATAISVMLPPAIAVTVPVEVLTGRATPTTIGVLLGAAAALVIAARLFWKFAVRSYSGASA